MRDKFKRRTVLTGIGGIISGGAIAYIATDDAEATAIQVDGLSVADRSQSISNPVSGLELTIDGTWTISSDRAPSKVVLRIQARATETNDFQQISATDYEADLSAEMGRNFNLQGNLLDLQGLDAPSLTPQETGQSISETVTVRIILEVRHDMQVTETHEVQDTATIEITRELAATNATISAHGNMSVQTS